MRWRLTACTHTYTGHTQAYWVGSCLNRNYTVIPLMIYLQISVSNEQVRLVSEWMRGGEICMEKTLLT